MGRNKKSQERILIPSVHFKIEYRPQFGEVYINTQYHGIVWNGIYEQFLTKVRDNKVRIGFGWYSDLIYHFNVHTIVTLFNKEWRKASFQTLQEHYYRDPYEPKSLWFLQITKMEKCLDKPN